MEVSLQVETVPSKVVALVDAASHIHYESIVAFVAN